ncbi:MAG: hypothetical protein E6Q97_17510 [Desulfurellales bacterium]|nr:MAG: hypothetical protein E6Q97_17510 [Desulfurellales bacterium]
MSRDLTDRISRFGTYYDRGMEAVKLLKQIGEASGTFDHNGLKIEVYQDSTIREIGWQFAYLNLRRERQ